MPGDLTIRGRIVRMGSQFSTSEAQVLDVEGKLLASGRGTYLTAPPKPASTGPCVTRNEQRLDILPAGHLWLRRLKAAAELPRKHQRRASVKASLRVADWRSAELKNASPKYVHLALSVQPKDG